MLDSFGREINYLRIAVTDRCNLRCRYCMPEEGVTLRPAGEILRLEEIAYLGRCATEVGIRRVRLTGGEPLVRKNLAYLVRALKEAGMEEISLTTNGTLLAARAEELKASGLDRVNVSLDTLDPARFVHLTRGGDLTQVLAGLRAAYAVGLSPVKINTVVARDLNFDEIPAFCELAYRYPVHVRFIEIMPVGQGARWGKPVPEVEITAELERLGWRLPVHPPAGNGPAESFTRPGAAGTVGIIGGRTGEICSRCNRVRLTALGGLRSCLYSDAEIEVKGPLRRGASREEIVALFRQAILGKPQAHPRVPPGEPGPGTYMSQIGG
ncbi:MAG: GTP 3',8-cyclase MoaA [Clostridia bacterium]|nr:MAG: GTP 3',8-cyclase MoaA [Clostridia bacterium]